MAFDKTPVTPMREISWPGLTKFNTLILNVDKRDLGIQTTPLEFANQLFTPKQETHITVFGSSLGAQLQQQFTSRPGLELDVCQAFESTDWSYQKTTDLRHLVKISGSATFQQVEESIIMLIKMEGMAVFYSKLKSLKMIADDYPLPPPHITLYTRNCDSGIGVRSDDELTALSRAHLKNFLKN